MASFSLNLICGVFVYIIVFFYHAPCLPTWCGGNSALYLLLMCYELVIQVRLVSEHHHTDDYVVRSLYVLNTSVSLSYL